MESLEWKSGSSLYWCNPISYVSLIVIVFSTRRTLVGKMAFSKSGQDSSQRLVSTYYSCVREESIVEILEILCEIPWMRNTTDVSGLSIRDKRWSITSLWPQTELVFETARFFVTADCARSHLSSKEIKIQLLLFKIKVLKFIFLLLERLQLQKHNAFYWRLLR